MSNMELTAKQIKDFDEIQNDKKAIDATLRTALQYHSNTLNQIRKKEDSLWKELSEIHGLDLSKSWTLDLLSASVLIVEKEKIDE